MSSRLEGRVAVVTGSSRGIGRAFVLRLAAEGARVVVTGKSETDSDRLPGTIFSVADEVRASGGEALAIKVDVRREEEIRRMVDETTETFGRLDILVNNAGALWWEPVADTPPNRAALMWDVNLRASYLASYYALPHMLDQKWGHIVTNSPPISVEPTPGHAMYNATKMGMTRLAIGIGAENRERNVAGNSLWPATPIDSLATRNWGEAKMGRPDQWRTPEIMCDALMEILSSAPTSCTARQLIDEPFLRERGFTEERLASY